MQKRKLNKSDIDLKLVKANVKRQILLKASNTRQNRQLVKQFTTERSTSVENLVKLSEHLKPRKTANHTAESTRNKLKERIQSQERVASMQIEIKQLKTLENRTQNLIQKQEKAAKMSGKAK